MSTNSKYERDLCVALDATEKERAILEKLLKVAIAQRDRLAEKMQLIASCVSHHKGDVVDIARAALAELDKKAGK